MGNLHAPQNDSVGTDMQAQAPNALANKIADPSFLNSIFANPDNAAEARMRDAIECVSRLVALSPDNAAKWSDAWSRAGGFDRRSGGDGFELESLTGNCASVDRWVSSSTTHLAELLTHPGSTFRDLGNGYAVAQAFAEASTSPLSQLVDVARQLRSAIHSKMFQTAAREICAERERRLGEAFGVDKYGIIPAMRWQYPSHVSIDLDKLGRYMTGDRSEDIMGIGEWVESSHPAAQACRPLHMRPKPLGHDSDSPIDV
ncbi:MAG: hypothetical protein NTX63_02910 [Candidatus Peregrinibacteria bacterium]|nr:hypothetical protein [Candidatus Peregrinibacteria bacterium]